MPDSPSAVLVDVLNSLLEAEQGSIFRYMGEGSPYLSKATAEIRQPLSEMVESGSRRAAQLSATIESLGGTPSARPLQDEEQYLSYLSLKFLLPKLVEAKKLLITRHENALQALTKTTPPSGVGEMLQSHLAEHRAQLAVLEHSAEEVAKAGK